MQLNNMRCGLGAYIRRIVICRANVSCCNACHILNMLQICNHVAEKLVFFFASIWRSVVMGTLSIYIKFHLEEGTGFVFLFCVK